jgi:hypothetical protein
MKALLGQQHDNWAPSGTSREGNSTPCCSGTDLHTLELFGMEDLPASIKSKAQRLVNLEEHGTRIRVGFNY